MPKKKKSKKKKTKKIKKKKSSKKRRKIRRVSKTQIFWHIADTLNGRVRIEGKPGFFQRQSLKYPDF